MEKEALLAIIINDLKEVDILMNTFNRPGVIDADFLQLAMTKINQITNEMKMLERFSSSSAPLAPPQVAQPVIAPVVVAPIVEVIKSKVPKVEIIEEITSTTPTEKSYFTLDSADETDDKSINNDLINTTPPPVIEPIIEVKTEAIIEEPKSAEPTIVKPEADTAKPIIEIEKPKEEIKKEEKHTLKDVLTTNKKSVNDLMNEKKTTPQPLGANIVVPVANIYKAIGINDKLLFQRELFSGKGDLMNQIIDQLNELKSFEEAQSFLSSRFDWDFENERVISFLNIVKRRYL